MFQYFPQNLRIYGSSFVSLYLCYSKRLVNLDHVDDGDLQIVLKRFWFYWSAGTVCIVVLYFILPDTDNLTLLEIEDLITFEPWIQPIRHENVGYSSTKSSNKSRADTSKRAEPSLEKKQAGTSRPTSYTYDYEQSPEVT